MRSTCLFVHLDGRLVAIDPNDFADELVMTNFYLRHSLAKCPPALWSRMEPYQLVHGNANHVLGNDDWPACTLVVSYRRWHAPSECVVATNPETE